MPAGWIFLKERLSGRVYYCCGAFRQLNSVECSGMGAMRSLLPSGPAAGPVLAAAGRGGGAAVAVPVGPWMEFAPCSSTSSRISEPVRIGGFDGTLG